MNIPLVNLQAQYKTIRKDVDRAILRVCKAADFILGDDVTQFEKEFARYVGTKYCVGVANGTDAIKLMLIASGIKKDDEVIIQANTFIATVLPVIEIGAKPVFVDCNPQTGAIDIDQVKKAITKKTRAILPVHLYGRPAPMKELLTIAKKHHLLVLEDAAQAHGATIGKKRCGSFGDMAAFSFYPGKNLGAYGDGGAIVTQDKKLAEQVLILRNIGQQKKYDHVVLGFNSRLDTVQAAVLRVKLKHLDTWNAKRRKIAQQYIDGLTGVGDLLLPDPPTVKTNTNYHLFVIRTNKRDALMAYLTRHGIHCGIHYPVPLHITPALKGLGYKKGTFPVSEKRAQTMISLPIYAEITNREVSYMIESMKRFFTI